jgi:hypothetical protein
MEAILLGLCIALLVGVLVISVPFVMLNVVMREGERTYER